MNNLCGHQRSSISSELGKRGRANEADQTNILFSLSMVGWLLVGSSSLNVVVVACGGRRSTRNQLAYTPQKEQGGKKTYNFLVLNSFTKILL